MERLTTLENWDSPPFNRWSFLNMDEIIPVKPVSRGKGPIRILEEEKRELGNIEMRRIDGSPAIVDDILGETETDGFLVLHRGKIVCEKYQNGMNPNTLHLAQSVSKSIVGTLAGIYLDRGLMEKETAITDFVPELRNSGYRDANIDHLLNMQTGVRFIEDYTDPEAEFALLDRASGWKDLENESDPESIYQLLTTVKSERSHGEYFQYRSIDTDVLAWICERVGGAHLADLISAEIWSKIGVEHDASFTVDRMGTALADGGFNASLRDYGRFGQLFLDEGSAMGRQIVSPEWISGCSTGDREKFRKLYGDFSRHYPNAVYSNQWWVVDTKSAILSARGVFGQLIYVDPISQLVAVKLSSWPDFLDNDKGLNTYRMVEAIADHLNKN